MKIEKTNPIFKNLNWTLTASSTDPTRPQLVSTVNVESSNGKTRFTSTDGHRLHCFVVDECEVEPGLYVSSKGKGFLLLEKTEDQTYPPVNRVVPDGIENMREVKLSVEFNSAVADIFHAIYMRFLNDAIDKPTDENHSPTCANIDYLRDVFTPNKGGFIDEFTMELRGIADPFVFRNCSRVAVVMPRRM